MTYEVLNILDMLEELGDAAVTLITDSFRCPRNASVERFVRSSAIDFAKQGISITYFVFSSDTDEPVLLGIFTLANKVLRVESGGMSRTTEKKLTRFADRDPDSNSFSLSAPLIAQFSKNDGVPKGMEISGHDLMECAIGTLRPVYRTVGGRTVYLECEDVPGLRRFYEDEGYRHVSERYAGAGLDDEGKLYHVYAKFLRVA